MAVNLATRYEGKIVERFNKGSLTEVAAGKDFKFGDAKTIILTSVNTVALNDFNRTGNGNRFGTVSNLGDTEQEVVMTQDKSFAFSIDAGDQSDQAINNNAGKALKREIEEVINPTVDRYRLGKWVNGAGAKVYTGNSAALTKNTILAAIIDVGAAMSNELVPVAGRTLFIPTRNYVKLVQADAIIGIDHGGYDRSAVEKGVVGMVDGAKVVPIPDGWFPEGAEFLIKHKSATADPVKFKHYHIHESPQGYDGPVVEGRIYYDAFVLDAKKAGCGICILGAQSDSSGNESGNADGE
ncbi:MAG: hypothetical protein II514_04570 [Ruminococcus sp.]|nr:hypothetical protein [Ruminococcus sp.]